MVNCLLGPFIFTVVNLKKGPTIPIVLHTAWARALSAIVIVCPHKIKIHIIQIKLHTSLHRSCYQNLYTFKTKENTIAHYGPIKALMPKVPVKV